MKRTVREFVEDLMTDSRNLKYIIAVAQASRWGSEAVEEIKEVYRSIRKDEK